MSLPCLKHSEVQCDRLLTAVGTICSSCYSLCMCCAYIRSAMKHVDGKCMKSSPGTCSFLVVVCLFPCFHCMRQVALCIMCTSFMSVRNNNAEHLKAVCGLPAQFPEVCLANFILPLGRTFLLLLLLKKRENTALNKCCCFLNKHS